MAVVTDDKSKPTRNGALKDPKGINGTNGVVKVNGVNGNAVAPGRRSTPPIKKRSFFASSFGIVARLLTWYSILTILFRCPSSLDACTESSPQICKPYFRVRNAVTPHVSPYYHTYAAPYVDIAKPYYDTLDRAVITPGRDYAVKYGGPRLSQAQAYGQAQWQSNVQPQILKYQTLARTKYDDNVSPHVEKVTTTVAPYYSVARTNALQTYHEFLLPTYQVAQPYAAQAYDAAHAFTANTAIPTTVWAWHKTYVFLDAAVWPHLRDVYVMKVEPQLVRIGSRLGRYKEKKVKTASDEADSAAVKSTFTKPSAVPSSTAHSAASISPESTIETDSAPAEVDTPDEETKEPKVNVETSKSPKDKAAIREIADKTVKEDLETWEGKFTQAAEEGASEIEDRVDDISARMIQRHANGMGKSLVSQLNETATSELGNLKQTIVTLLEKYKDSPEKREEEITAAIRGAGLKIKNKAQDVRTWRQNYDQETEMAVTKAAQEHFTVLEQVRDLAYQKLGMKWAWMDGVTYKHWQMYHEMKARFTEWTEDLKRLIATHPGLIQAQAAGIDIEDQAMDMAQTAAQELGRIKQVAGWKATAGDFSDDFESETMELAAEAALQKLAEAGEAASSAVDSVAENAEAGAASVSQAVSSGVSKVVSPSDTDTSMPADSEEAETVTVSLSQVDEDSGTSDLPPMDSLTSEPTEPASNLSAQDPSETPLPADQETNDAEPVEPLPTSEPVDGPEQVQETIVETPDEPAVEQPAATTVKSAMFGAAAQSVPSRQPILDEDLGSSASSIVSVVQSDVPASITSAAQAAYSTALVGAADQYSRAMSAVSVQISGEPKPAHEEMLSSVSDAYFGAVAAANSRLNSAMTAASEGVYGTPTTKWMPDMPTMPSVDWEKAQSIASQNLQDSINWASEQYEAAKVAIGAAEPTPSTYLEGAEKRAEKLLDQAKHNYFAGLGLAHARYEEFMSAASTAVSSMTATPTPTNIQESASSYASEASESVVSAASAASGAAESVASSVGQVASGASDTIGETWDSLLSRVSSQIYTAPTPTPFYENLYAAAGDYASAAGEYASDKASSVGDSAASVTSMAGEYAASGTDAAASQYSAMSSLLSELIVGREPPFSESVFSRLQGAYATASSSASSLASVASGAAVSAASEVTEAAGAATDKVKETVDHLRDEL
ncbi:hypothetical protein F4778DRAFT_88453 [Xylariomycetidae sp. FL2044]|nr:hypothetical protein F4778DRAFT_88453 [Xylariomycetidae sp. FL2044]